MQVQPVEMQHALHWWHIVVAATAGGSFTAGAIKFGQYIAKALPPLPKTAGWWQTFGYNIVQGISGLDPNVVSLKPYDGTVDRRAK